MPTTKGLAPGLLFASALLAVSLVAGCAEAPVTGRDQLILLPEDQAETMGAQAYQQILDQQPIVSRNDSRSRMVQEIGERLVAVSDAKDLPWTFNVIEDPTPNAFALPGGKVGVHTGMFEVARTRDQLAAVMAHEVGHVAARHSSERISRQLLVEAGLQAGQALSGAQMAQYSGLLAQAASLGLVLPFSREQESEADEIGLMYMARAGYDPRAAVEVWKNMQKAGGPTPPEFLSTHPAAGTRIERLQALMPKALSTYRKAIAQR